MFAFLLGWLSAIFVSSKSLFCFHMFKIIVFQWRNFLLLFKKIYAGETTLTLTIAWELLITLWRALVLLLHIPILSKGHINYRTLAENKSKCHLEGPSMVLSIGRYIDRLTSLHSYKCMHIQSIGRKTDMQDKYKTMIGILYS